MSALSEISPLSLQLLHHRAAEALEAEFSESPDGGRLWDAARHREAAGETERAVELLDQCATRAMALGTPGDAAQALGYALSMAPAGHLRDTLHARRIHALYLGREYTGLVAAADAARRERGGQVDTTTAHTAEELFELDATLFALGPTVALIDRATACAKAAGAEPDHRVGAGMIALKAASMIARGRVAKRILQSVEPVLSAASPHVAAEFRLIYHGSYGSVQESANEARTLLSTLDAPKHAVLRAKALHQCSIAFYLNGELEMAERCAAEARELGVSLHIPSIVRSATQLALINAMDVGDLERADAVMASTALLADATDGVNARINDTFLAMHALLRGDLATAARWIGPFTDIFGGQYARETGAVVEQRAHYRMLADGWVPSDGDMTHMIRVHRAERLNRGGDSLLRVIVMALEMRGERARAQALVTRYLTRYRRERGPLMRQLRELLEKLGYPIADPAAPRVTAAARGTGAAEVTSLP
jgi:hypothetical protein